MFPSAASTDTEALLRSGGHPGDPAAHVLLVLLCRCLRDRSAARTCRYPSTTWTPPACTSWSTTPTTCVPSATATATSPLLRGASLAARPTPSLLERDPRSRPIRTKRRWAAPMATGVSRDQRRKFILRLDLCFKVSWIVPLLFSDCFLSDSAPFWGFTLGALVPTVLS